MARCRCSETTCICTLIAGTGVSVVGAGTAANPWVVSSAPDAGGVIGVEDTTSIDMAISGAGNAALPYLISGRAKIGPLIQFANSAEITFTVTGTGVEGDPLIVSAFVV